MICLGNTFCLYISNASHIMSPSIFLESLDHHKLMDSTKLGHISSNITPLSFNALSCASNTPLWVMSIIVSGCK